MKILVTIKRAPHRDIRMKAGPDGALPAQEFRNEINPFDENALEEALRVKEKHTAEVIAVTVGPESAGEQLLAALAMGADRAIRVDTGAAATLDSLQTARCLAAIARRESPDLILCGKLAVDDENAQVPAMLAELLDWPQASQAVSIEFASDGRNVRVKCEVDSGTEEVELKLPALITADLRLNEPRYASVVGIMKSRKKPQEIVPLAQVGEIGPERVTLTRFRPLPAKARGIRVESAEALAAMLLERRLI